VVVSFISLQAVTQQVSVAFTGSHPLASHVPLPVADDQPAKLYSRDYSKIGDQAICRFGSKGSGDGQFCWPRSVACNSRGDIVVADCMNHRIQVFDRNGKYLFKFGSNGKGNGQFDEPRGVIVDQRTNQIVVADSGNNRIQIFDEKGTFLRAFGSKGDADGQFSEP